MANVFEENLREASCVGDIEAVESLLKHNVDINSKNAVNGWTALHWACKRGNEDVVKILMNNGADPKVETFKGETAAHLCSNSSILALLGISDDSAISSSSSNSEDNKLSIIPNYLRNPPVNPQVDIGNRTRSRHSVISNMPTTMLPAVQADDLVLKVRIANSSDPDYIEVELPRWKLTYSTLLNVCCEELQIQPSLVERIRKLPNTRLRKDSDVKRLTEFQCLEIVIKTREKVCNGFQSISTCKDQTILY
ncbi:ankyrin repeat domain-containing protein 40 isoform X1 [Agrilus planipennis]|uniref:Ankyrin repeat domain-containing protein 40 isoform X1 n=1 Tax=Agrilus planipennis TaxID=224129 RepID=A0A1W4XBC2_AGRPL|nr:ankyrin repeat domain-containing protein 40 isoform X1 [Agrilus planipennis]XP_018329725.1 ankyrin repeat domain-containing protein 40 isoform X1 [Agrilus planipennis]XP_018329726.1 ankyrin repeat domain-containing protein 40 isoform X1 [Agrilus planipennis]XP_018329727.1 ankyrin repeat domain-containing protein 40 isoform X1 [Agrilus planipennis]